MFGNGFRPQVHSPSAYAVDPKNNAAEAKAANISFFIAHSFP